MREEDRDPRVRERISMRFGDYIETGGRIYAADGFQRVLYDMSRRVGQCLRS
jgi:hypothetical protein